MTVKEIMKVDVATCAPGSDLTEAARTMRDRACGFLPVVDSRGTVVGVVTDRDVCLAVSSKKPPVNTAVSEVMSHEVFGCFEDEHVRTALATMSKHHVRRLPVVEKAHGHLRGVISLDDVALAPRRRGSPTNDDVAGALRAICARPMIEQATV